MAASVTQVIDEIAGIVSGTTPAVDVGIAPLETAFERVTVGSHGTESVPIGDRAFAITATHREPPLIGFAGSQVMAILFEIQIRYSVDRCDTATLGTKIADDAARIIARLRNPSNWTYCRVILDATSDADLVEGVSTITGTAEFYTDL